MKIILCEAGLFLALRWPSKPQLHKTRVIGSWYILFLYLISTVLMDVRLCYVLLWTSGVLNKKITLIFGLASVFCWKLWLPLFWYGHATVYSKIWLCKFLSGTSSSCFNDASRLKASFHDVDRNNLARLNNYKCRFYSCLLDLLENVSQTLLQNYTSLKGTDINYL